MRELSAELQGHLASRATTLCHCWKVTTAAGESLGFTDHDREIGFDGVTYEAQAGFTASEIEQSLGFAVDNLDATGALKSDRLSEVRIAAGDFDHAAVEVWRVNWQDVSQRYLLRKGHLGEVTRGSMGFTAEIRGLTELFDQTQGRLFQFGCDAVLGDTRCTVDLSSALLRGNGAVTGIEDNRRLIVSGLTSFSDGWFARGTLRWTSGANEGRLADVKVHRRSGGIVALELWQAAPVSIVSGDRFTVTAGCDRQFATCRSKFANGVNFRGFPQMPGDDFVLTYPTRGDDANTGNSRNS
jgi:uncharacterized phage protein (TIGR02218 family)